MIKTVERLVADGEDEVFVIPDDHMPGVLEGLQQAERGEFATNEEMTALWRKWA